jgi:small subunit ribosomal protein S6
MAGIVQNYEAMVILNPTLAEPEREALVEKLRKLIVGGGSVEIKETALWGKRRLAYPIEKKPEGYYVIFYFQSADAHEQLAAFEKACRYDENIMRGMTLKVPTRKRGQAVAQLVPAPGWLANFKLEPRSGGPRRRPDGFGPPRDRETPAPVAAAAPETPAPEAVAAPETPAPAPQAAPMLEAAPAPEAAPMLEAAPAPEAPPDPAPEAPPAPEAEASTPDPQ